MKTLRLALCLLPFAFGLGPRASAQNGGTAFVVPSGGGSGDGVTAAEVTNIVESIVSTNGTPSSSTNALGAPATNLLWGRTIFVDATHGNNATAIRGDASKPYLSASNAIAAAQSGDTVLFRPGTYTVPTLPSGWETNGPLKLWTKRDIIVAGMNGATLQAGGLGTMFTLGFFTNITFRDLIIEGVVTNGQYGGRYGVIWCRGQNKGLKLERVTMRNHSNQGVDTDPYPSVGWITEDIEISNCRFEKIGSTNALAGLSNDGTPIDLGGVGRGVKILNNWFLEGLRHIEFYQQDSGVMWLEDVLIQGNTSVSPIHQFLGIGSTNARNIKVIDNSVVMSPTNATAAGLQRNAMEFYGGKGVLFSGNSITGAPLGIVYKTDSQGDADGIIIQNNIFDTIPGTGIYMYRATASGPAPKRVIIADNLFRNLTDFGIYGQFTDGWIARNTFLDVGIAGYAPVYFGANGGASPATNTVIHGNKFLKSGDIAYTAYSIELGSSAYDTHLFWNGFGSDVGAIVNNGTSTKGIAGRNIFDLLGNAAPGKVLMNTNANGEATWGVLSNFADVNITNFLTVSNIKTVSLTVTNIASFSNAVFRAAESDWTIYAHPLSDSLFITNNGYGLYFELHSDPTVGTIHHKRWTNAGAMYAAGALWVQGPVTNLSTLTNAGAARFGGSLWVQGPQTNRSDIWLENNASVIAGVGSHFADLDFAGDKVLVTSGNEIVESAIGNAGSPQGLQVPGEMAANSATITNQLIVGNALTNSPFIVKNGGTNVAEVTTNGNFLAWAGTVSKPAFGWLVDDDAAGTGLYRSAANQIGFSVNGGAIGIMYSAGLSLGFPLQFGAAASSPDTEIKRIASGVVGVGATNIYLRDVTVTNNIGFQVGTVAGVGGANTNFTLQAAADESIIYVDAGTTNVNLVAIMGYSSTIAYRGTVILTNRTATARTLSLGATTNNWLSLQADDGISAPFTITNSRAGRLSWEILGTNVQYSYKGFPLPSN